MRTFTFTSVIFLSLLLPLAAQAKPSKVDVPAERPRLGISIDSGRLYVAEVDMRSLGAKAKFLPGDVLLSWNKEELRGFATIRRMIKGAKADAKQRIQVRRGEKTRTLEVTFGSGPRSLGLVVFEGLAIASVRKASVARRAGVLRGDFMLSFGRLEEPTFDALLKALRALEPGSRVPLRVMRDAKPLDLLTVFQGGAPKPALSPGLGQRGPGSQPRWAKMLADLQQSSGRMLSDAARVEEMARDLSQALEQLQKSKLDVRATAALGKIRRVRDSLRRMGDTFAKARGMMESVREFEFPDLKRLHRPQFRPEELKRLFGLVEKGLARGTILDIMKKEFPGLIFDFLEEAKDGLELDLRTEREDDDNEDEDEGRR
ncbi:MAG: PDZ domain-containing protein [Planctomycetota bacterium]